jgi:hypothetical protein
MFCRLKPKPGEETADGYVCGRGQKWPPALTLLTKKVRSKVDASLFCRSSLASGANWCSSTFGCSSTSFLLFTFFLMRNGNDLPLLSFLLLPTFIMSLSFSLFQRCGSCEATHIQICFIGFLRSDNMSCTFQSNSSAFHSISESTAR